jgi:hypothetical protein
MDRYTAGVDLTLTLTLSALAGRALDATALRWRLLDAQEIEMQSFQAVSGYTAGDDTFQITVLAADNTLQANIKRDGRIVEIEVTLADGDKQRLRYIYAIAESFYLSFMVNSYQTYTEALLNALDLSELDYWAIASEERRIEALADAYHRIGKLSFAIYTDTPQNRYYTDYGYGGGAYRIDRLNEWTAADVLVLPAPFLTALKRAQIVEADYRLGGLAGTAERRRQAGLMSETIGESSNMFRPGKPLALPVSRAALEQLSGYVKIHNLVFSRV